MEDLKSFVAVVGAGGFSAAAARLGTTTAAVSRRVKALERRLGVRLLQRTTRRIHLTEAGELYYREVARLLGELDGVEAQVQEITAEPAGDLRIAAPMSFGQHRLGELVARFAAAHPRLRVSLNLDDRESDLLREGVDLALRIGYPVDSGLVARPIMAVPRHLCAAPAYLERAGTPQTPADLVGHQCLHYNLISESEEWTFEGPEGVMRVAVGGRYCSNNGDILLEAALQGLGITLLPHFLVDRALAEGRLVRLLADHERQPMTLMAMYPSRHFVPTKTRLFIDFLASELAVAP